MDNIQTQLERLKSPNKNTRYDACEMLRVAPSVPQEVADALLLATRDPDRLVAEAARNAIALHTNPTPTAAVEHAPMAVTGFWGNPWHKLLAVGLLFPVTFLVMSVLHWMLWRELAGRSLWFIFPVVLIAILFSTGDYVGPEAFLAGWLIYFVMMIAVVVIDEGRVAKALYLALAFLLLVNVVAWMLLFG